MGCIQFADGAGYCRDDCQQAHGLLLDEAQESGSYDFHNRRMAGSRSLRFESIAVVEQTVVGADGARRYWGAVSPDSCLDRNPGNNERGNARLTSEAVGHWVLGT
jgi:hypothetical protein